MKAPNKIYVEVCEDGIFAFPEPPFKESVEYIRKDALLEWLDGKLTIEGATEGFVGGYDSALKDVIKHIRYNISKNTQRKKLHK